MSKHGNPVDALWDQAMSLDPAAFDDLRDRLNRYSERETYGDPDGRVTIILGPDHKYRLDDSTSDERWDDYSDALDHARIAYDDEMLSPERCPLFFYSALTGVEIQLPPVDQIDVNFDRPVNDEHRTFFALSDGAVGVEAFCALCGETCNPHGADDMTHGVRMSDERPCGGPLVPVGWWK